MKAFIERAAIVADGTPELLKYKVGTSFSVARRAGSLTAIDTMNHFFMNHEMFIVGSSYWNVAFGQMPKDVLQDEEGIATILNLGENKAFLLNQLNKA